MRAIMVMYDTLCKRTLPNYGDTQAKMPAFERLADLTVTFDNCYVGSLPCMPARREIHTGRMNFLHRGWGPIEPFDDSMPEILKRAGIYTHLVSDHDHYWEDGGATYHTRYNTWENERGQEIDTWKGDLHEISDTHSFGAANPEVAKFLQAFRKQNAINRIYIEKQGRFPQENVFDKGIEFIETNHEFDNWFLQIETFDPHEPFTAPEDDQKLNGTDESFQYDWPPAGKVREDDAFIGEVKKKYYSLLTTCDRSLGRVLDIMDKYDMWKDTMLIVNTDHGFLLSEHDWWGKNVMPMYNEIANIPLFIWDPRTGVKGERREALVQTIDMAPTILNFFGIEPTRDMLGKDLAATIEKDEKVRDYAVYGIFGGQTDITDGKYVYMRSPVTDHDADGNPVCYEYTLMPTDMMNRKPVEQLQKATLAEPFSFTKGMPVLKLPAKGGHGLPPQYGDDALYDLSADPGQRNPITDEAVLAPVRERMLDAMAKVFCENDAPAEQYIRLGLKKPE